jgi:hypothetical protein
MFLQGTRNILKMKNLRQREMKLEKVKNSQVQNKGGTPILGWIVTAASCSTEGSDLLEETLPFFIF